MLDLDRLLPTHSAQEPLAKLNAHLYTLFGRLIVKARLRAQALTPSALALSETRPLELEVSDPLLGRGSVSALYTPSQRGHKAPLLLIAPGLGGDERADYLEVSARLARQRGWASLRVSHRGTGRSSPGLYHAGSYQELGAWLEHSELSSHERVMFLGFSMGGHQVTRLMCAPEFKGRAVAASAISAPLKLALTQRLIDAPAFHLYRVYLLIGLKEMASRLWSQLELEAREGELCAQRSSLLRALRQLSSVKRLYEWDQRVMCTTFGWTTPQEYYHTQEAVRHLSKLHTPLALFPSRYDPVVPYESALPTDLERYMSAQASRSLTLAPRGGGHIYSPQLTEARGVIGQALQWLSEQP